MLLFFLDQGEGLNTWHANNPNITYKLSIALSEKLGLCHLKTILWQKTMHIQVPI